MAIKAAHAASVLPSEISMTQPTTTAEDPDDVLKEWTKHVGHITELVPIEVMVFICLLLWFAFKVARIIYAARRADTARTCLFLEIGNGTEVVVQYFRFWLFLRLNNLRNNFYWLLNLYN